MISTLLILFFLFSGALYLETLMPYLANFQLIVILTGIIAAFVLFYLEMTKKKEAAAFAIIFYSFALFDLLFLVFMTRQFSVFLLISLFAVLGLVKAIFSLECCETNSKSCCAGKINTKLETYDTREKDSEEATRVAVTPILVETKPKKTLKKTKKVKKKIVKKKVKKTKKTKKK